MIMDQYDTKQHHGWCVLDIAWCVLEWLKFKQIVDNKCI
jgi:hypothetical protein